MEEIDELIVALRATQKYAHICEPALRRVGLDELKKRRSLKEAIKESKNTLHQIGGAYQEKMKYAAWLHSFPESGNLALSALREWAEPILLHHASTRERVPILQNFYAQIFAALGEVHSILDVACGLNPLTVSHMPLLPNTQYYALDIYEDMMQFVGAFFARAGVNGSAYADDVFSSIHNTSAPLHTPVDVAFVLKTIPCLEQVDKKIGSALLDNLNAKQMVVSFPLQSLGGKRKGMGVFYTHHFEALVAGKNWQVKELTFESELVFVVKK